MTRERGGFVKVPRALLDAMWASLAPGQDRVLLALLGDAQWEPGTVLVRGRPVLLDVGEALIGTRGLATRIGLDRDAIRRAIDAFERLGWISRRPAWPGPETGPEAAPQPTPQPAPPRRPYRPPLAPAPPPTIIRFLRHRQILWGNGEASPSYPPLSAAPDARAEAAPQPAPIQEERRKTRDERQQPRAGAWPACSDLAAALSERWGTNVALPAGPQRAEVEAAVAALGVEDALVECVEDVGTAYRGRRIDGPPGSLGFFTERLRAAASRRGPAAAGGAT